MGMVVHNFCYNDLKAWPHYVADLSSGETLQRRTWRQVFWYLKNSVFFVLFCFGCTPEKYWIYWDCQQTFYVTCVHRTSLHPIMPLTLCTDWQTLVANNRRIKIASMLFIWKNGRMAVNWAYWIVWHLCGVLPSYLIGMFHQLERTLRLSTLLRTMVSVTEASRKWAVLEQSSRALVKTYTPLGNAVHESNELPRGIQLGDVHKNKNSVR